MLPPPSIHPAAELPDQMSSRAIIFAHAAGANLPTALELACWQASGRGGHAGDDRRSWREHTPAANCWRAK